MVHAYLIVGTDSDTRLQKAQEIASKLQGVKIDFSIDYPDIFILEEKDSIKINQVRNLKKSLGLKPFSMSYKIALVKEADKLTLPAQNAFLKTLEEPPGNSVIIMTVPNTDLLLATILSRCQIIRLPGKLKKYFKDDNELKKSLRETLAIIKANPGERLLFAESVAQTREKALEFIDGQLFTWRKIIHRRFLEEKGEKGKNFLKDTEIVKTTRQIQQARNMIMRQVNHRLVIENLLLSYPKD